MSGFIGGLFGAIFGIGGIILFFWGFMYLMNKFFGVELTSRSNYKNRVRQNAQEHSFNLRELEDIDQETINEAKRNLSKKLFAHTSSNIIEEAKNVQNKNPSQNNLKPNLTAIPNYEVLHNFIFKNAIYYAYYNNSTTYVKILNNNEGILASFGGEPNAQIVDYLFKLESNDTIKFEYKFDGHDTIKFDVFHNGRSYWYSIYSNIHSKTPVSLKCDRGIPFGQTIARLNFNLFK